LAVFSQALELRVLVQRLEVQKLEIDYVDVAFSWL
jgi:hypothetical protein